MSTLRPKAPFVPVGDLTVLRVKVFLNTPMMSHHIYPDRHGRAERQDASAVLAGKFCFRRRCDGGDSDVELA